MTTYASLLALALTLAAARQLHTLVRAQLGHRWAAELGGRQPAYDPNRFTTLRGAHVVIWGFGSIAQTLAPVLTTLGARVTGVARSAGAVPCGYIYVDGSSVGEITDAELKDRRTLSEEGFISIFAAVDIIESKVVAGPEIHARGLGLDDAEFDGVLDQVRTVLEDALRDGDTDPHDLQQRVRRTVGKWVSTAHRRRPMIVPVVVEA